MITTAATIAGGGAITRAQGEDGGGAWTTTGTVMTRIMGETEAGLRVTTDAMAGGVSTAPTNTDLQDRPNPTSRRLQSEEGGRRWRPAEPCLAVLRIRRAIPLLPPRNLRRHLLPQVAEREVSRPGTSLTPTSTAHPSQTSTPRLHNLSRRHPPRVWGQCSRIARTQRPHRSHLSDINRTRTHNSRYPPALLPLPVLAPMASRMPVKADRLVRVPRRMPHMMNASTTHMMAAMANPHLLGMTKTTAHLPPFRLAAGR